MFIVSATHIYLLSSSRAFEILPVEELIPLLMRRTFLFKPGNPSKTPGQDGLFNAFTGFRIAAYAEYMGLF